MIKKKLVVVSHTEHYKTSDGVIKGWGSTINELNYLADYWDEVVHVGCLYPEVPLASALPYSKANIRFVAIPPYGGKSIRDKIGILIKIPKIISQVVKSQRGATEVQLRLPTSMGLFLLPLFSYFLIRKYTLWVKYAGNWNQTNPPLSYRVQRWWLKKNLAKCAVTINGFWKDQPKHCNSFENPCLTDIDIELGSPIARNKLFDGKFTFAFVGRLEDAKGVGLILEALQKIPFEKINEVHFVGDGSNMDFYKRKAAFLETKVIFHGFLGKQGTHAILAQAHFFLLPSASEGFPKVIAEAACYGTIPVVSDVGSIPHYINPTNGFVWKKGGKTYFEEVLTTAVESDIQLLENKSKALQTVANMFTFENYRAKLERFIFNKT